MLCVKCQAELERDASFCGTCGTAVHKGEPLDSKELFRQASKFFDGDPKKAKEIYRKIIDDYPSSKEAEPARACLYNIQQRELKAQGSPADESDSVHRYISTYNTGRQLAKLISFIGWLVGCGGSIGALVSVAFLLGGKDLSGLALLPLGASLLIAIGGVLLVAHGQFVRATFDSADSAGQTLALMKSRMK